jgi:transcriptional regulator with XRE-family HTH domain
MRLEERVGLRVREAREEKGWSQRYLGEVVEHHLGKRWSPQTVYAAEKGERDFAIRDLVALARVLDKTVQWFLMPPMPPLAPFGERVQDYRGVPIDEGVMHTVYGTPRSEVAAIRQNIENELRRLDKIEGEPNP